MSKIQCFNPYNLNLIITVQVIDYYKERTMFRTSNNPNNYYFTTIKYNADCSEKNKNNPYFVGELELSGSIDNDTTIPNFLGPNPIDPIDTEMYFYTEQINSFSALTVYVLFCKFNYTINVLNQIEECNINMMKYTINIKPDQNCIFMSNNIPICLNPANYNAYLKNAYPFTTFTSQTKEYDFSYSRNQLIINGINGDPSNDNNLITTFVMNLCNNILD